MTESRTQIPHLAYNLSSLPSSHRVTCLWLDPKKNTLSPTQVTTGKQKASGRFWKMPLINKIDHQWKKGARRRMHQQCLSLIGILGVCLPSLSPSLLFFSLPPSFLFFLPFFLSDWGRAHCAGQTGLNFKLPLLPECWDDRWELSCPAPLISSWAL